MKHSVGWRRTAWGGVLGGIYLCTLLIAVFTVNTAMLIACALILLFFMILMSRAGSRDLRRLHESFLTAVRADERFDVPCKRVIGRTLQCMSPFYCIWILSGLFLPLGGYGGWLAVAFPTLFLSFWILKAVGGLWQELGLKRVHFWSLQAICYAVAVSHGVILAGCIL